MRWAVWGIVPFSPSLQLNGSPSTNGHGDQGQLYYVGGGGLAQGLGGIMWGGGISSQGLQEGCNSNAAEDRHCRIWI